MKWEPNYYLKNNVEFEPLINQWYAWGYLVYPVTAAMVVSNLHVRILKSFVQQPDLHRKAVAERAMRGGMFLDHDGEVASVENLLLRTESKSGFLLELAEAVKELDSILLETADGTSLIDLYQEVPDILKGVVELVYDMQHKPSFRFIEAFIYDSRFYDESLQGISLKLSTSDHRPFVLSCPRFERDDSLHISIPFNSKVLERLFSMREAPGSLEIIKKELNISALKPEKQALFDSYFTQQPPVLPADRQYTGDGVRVRYFGHACVLVQSQNTNILIDPLISYVNSEGTERFTYLDLPETIDYVLLTHNHQDHVMFETLLQIRHKIKKIIVPRSSSGLLHDPSLKRILMQIGFACVEEIDELESIDVDDGNIFGVPFFGEHADLSIRTKMAYSVTLCGRRFMFLADSNALEPLMYDRLKPYLPNVDQLFLGLECDGAPLSWLYGPLYTRPVPRKMDLSRRLNSSDSTSAMKIVRSLNPENVFIYAMGLEPWLGYISSISYTDESKPIVESDKLIDECGKIGIGAEKLYLKKQWVLEPIPDESR